MPARLFLVEQPWVDWSWLATHVPYVLAAVQEHVQLTVIAVIAGLAISLLLGVLAHTWRVLRFPVLAIFGIFYTIPSIAMFALLIPITGLSGTSAEIPLIGYNVLVLVRNVIVGLDSVPADVLDAADGMGYRRFARLLRVELPRAVRGPAPGRGAAAGCSVGKDGMSLRDLWQWFADPVNRQGPDGIPTRLAEHLHLSIESLLIGAAIALPIGIVLGHYGRFGTLAINITNVGRAVPSFGIIVIAFLALGLGDAPIILTLTALAIPPMVTNSYVALREVDPDVKEAARGMGYRELAQLLRVELPLAVPLIMAGVRTSAVQVVATATVAALIAGGGLGRYIIDGLATQDYVKTAAGAVLVGLLALSTELALAVLERGLVPRGIRLMKAPVMPRATTFKVA